jgi:hypothetical protein
VLQPEENSEFSRRLALHRRARLADAESTQDDRGGVIDAAAEAPRA